MWWPARKVMTTLLGAHTLRTCQMVSCLSCSLSSSWNLLCRLQNDAWSCLMSARMFGRSSAVWGCMVAVAVEAESWRIEAGRFRERVCWYVPVGNEMHRSFLRFRGRVT